ncbi:MAG: hypothetical protein Q7R33_05905 [Nitrosarchaeum sp.]|nr:hypothetical protein [Nitrosarchaeum sp.]
MENIIYRFDGATCEDCGPGVECTCETEGAVKETEEGSDETAE